MRILRYAGMGLIALVPGYLASMPTGSVVFGGVLAVFLFLIMLYYSREARHHGRDAKDLQTYEGREHAVYGGFYAGSHFDGGFGGGGCGGDGGGGGAGC